MYRPRTERRDLQPSQRFLTRIPTPLELTNPFDSAFQVTPCLVPHYVAAWASNNRAGTWARAHAGIHNVDAKNIRVQK